MALENIVVLVGGVGGAKLAHGLAQILPPERLTVIVNTGDDFWHYGLRVCPDLDTVTYTLAGIVDRGNGWGVSGDTRAMLTAMRRYGEDPWFGLGDQDIATHLLRTQALHAGETLTQVTQKLTRALGIPCTVLPMTDTEMPTLIDTVEYGELEFQVYFVKHRWQPTVRSIRYANAETARVSAEAAAAIERADAVLIAPSNPWLSIAPILAVPGMRDLLCRREVPCVAVSPIVDGKAIKGPAAKLMAELGYGEVSARSVAAYYRGFINGYVYDQRDVAQPIQEETMRVTAFDTLMTTEAHRAELAQQILNWIGSW